MEDDTFCQMFLYSLINLICFLLSSVFLATLNIVKSQAKILGIIDDENFISYKNSYTAIATLFSFGFFGFLAFMVILMILIKQIKVNKMDNERWKSLQRNTNINSEERFPIENYGYSTSGPPDCCEVNYEKLTKILLFLFAYSQIIYVIELIVLTVYLGVSKGLEGDLADKEKADGKYFTKIYRDLIIVGYILLFFFVLFDLYSVILICKFRRGNNTQNVENLTENRYCSCCDQIIVSCCQKMSNFFNELQKEGPEVKTRFEKKKEELGKNIEELETYRKNLEVLNDKIRKGQKVGPVDMKNLNLPCCDTTVINVTKK